MPVGPEILQRYDEAVKRFNESRAQAKAKAAPRGGAQLGVTASMIVLDPEESEGSVVAHAVMAPDSDQCYAMVDSGTNAIIVPLHPEMKGEHCRISKSQVRLYQDTSSKSLNARESGG